MLFENFYEDSHGNSRSAGVIDVPIKDFCRTILDHGSFPRIAYSAWNPETQELYLHYNNVEHNKDTMFIYALPTPEELETFRKLIPQIPHY